MSSMAETNLVYRPGEHPLHGTWLSVDVVAFTDDPDVSRVVLIKRKKSPHRGEITLPGGLLAAWNEETVADTARRVIAEKTGADIITGVVPVDVVSDHRRDERGHTVTIVVATMVGPTVRHGVPGAVYLNDVPDTMPFGHTHILRKTVTTVGQRLLHDSELTRALLGETTTTKRVMALLRACSPHMTVSGTRGRWERCRMYRPAGTVPGPRRPGRPGRPETEYRWDFQ